MRIQPLIQRVTGSTGIINLPFGATEHICLQSKQVRKCKKHRINSDVSAGVWPLQIAEETSEISESMLFAWA